jgi:hypothetical protein
VKSSPLIFVTSAPETLVGSLASRRSWSGGIRRLDGSSSHRLPRRRTLFDMCGGSTPAPVEAV